MRVPRPPASTTAAGFWVIGRKVLGRQDSNLGSRDQNPLPYRLATPHQIRDTRPRQSATRWRALERPQCRRSRHCLYGRRRKRRLRAWLRPTKLGTLDRVSRPAVGKAWKDGMVGGAATASMVGVASDASALGYAPRTLDLPASGEE